MGGEIPVYNATLLKPTPQPVAPPATPVTPVQATIIQPIAKPTIPADVKPETSTGAASEISIYNSNSPATTPTVKPPSSLGQFLGDLLHGVLENPGSGGTATTPTTPTQDTKPEEKKPDPKPEDKKPDAPKLGKKVTFTSVADPHVTTGSGKKFDDNVKGDMVLAKSKSGDLEVQAHNDSIPGDSGIWQTQGAVKTNGDVVKYDAASNTVDINGKKVPFKAGEKIELPSGGYVQMTSDKLSSGTPFNRLQVHTKQGDDVYMLNFQRKNGGHELDIRGDISADRTTDDVMGAAGAIDGDSKAENDLKTRDGKVTSDLSAFLDDWKAKPGESLFG